MGKTSVFFSPFFDFHSVFVGRDYPSYEKGNVWAEPDEDLAAELMRRVFEDRELREDMGWKAAEDMRTGYSPQAIGRLYRQRLEHIGRFG